MSKFSQFNDMVVCFGSWMVVYGCFIWEENNLINFSFQKLFLRSGLFIWYFFCEMEFILLFFVKRGKQYLNTYQRKKSIKRFLCEKIVSNHIKYAVLALVTCFIVCCVCFELWSVPPHLSFKFNFFCQPTVLIHR